MLLYVVKHSRPNIANKTQELSKVMDGVNQAIFLEIIKQLSMYLIPEVLDLSQNQKEVEKISGILFASALVIMLEIQSQGNMSVALY